MPFSSLLSYSKQCQKCTKTCRFHSKKSENFLGSGCPSINPFPMGRGHPSPYCTPQVPPLQLDPSYDTGMDIVGHFSEWTVTNFMKAFYARKQLLLLVCLSHRNSVCSIRPSVTREDQSKTVQAMITKSSSSTAWRSLVSGTVKLFHKFEGVTLNESAKWEGVRKICDL